MSLTSFLRSHFLEYAHTHTEEVKLCFNINSMYGRPYYYYTVYYTKDTNQLVLEGYNKKRDEPIQEYLIFYENATDITVGDFLMDRLKLTDDPTDILIQGYEDERETILKEKVIETEHRTIWICN
jgi:hypothetical protein